MKTSCSLFLVLLLFTACRESMDLRDSIEGYLQTSPVTLIDSADDSGFSTDNITVELFCEDPSAEIWYTTDRSTPTSGNGDLYSGEITLSGHNTPIVFKAAAVREDSLDSEIVTKDYLIIYNGVPTPGFGIPGGSYTTGQSISLSCSISTAVIWYTIDGTSPKTSSTRIKYTSPVSLNSNGETVVINCYAEEEGIPDSEIATASYTLNYARLPSPAFSPGPGQQDSAVSVSLNSAGAGEQILYTVDGTDPESSPTAKIYTGDIVLDWAGYTERTIRAVALCSGMETSDVSVGYYYLQREKSNVPSLTDQPGFHGHGGTVYSNADTVPLLLESPDDGAEIFYTLNGSMPMVRQDISEGGTSYTLLSGSTRQYDPSNPQLLTVETEYTINAIAFNGIKSASRVYSQKFTIDRTPPVVSIPDLPSSQDRGDSNLDNITNYNGSFQLNGSIDSDSTVELYVDGSPLDSQTAGSGNFNFLRTLGEGSYDISFRATDYAGNVTTGSSMSLVVDRSISSPGNLDLDAADDTGKYNNDNVTNKSTVTLSGTREAGTSFMLIDDGVQHSGVVFNPSGSSFTADVTLPADRNYYFKVRYFDVAGNTADSPTTLTVRRDTVSPTASVPDLAANDDQGISNSDNITNQLTGLTFSGTSSENDTDLVLLVNGGNQGSTSISGTSYSFDNISLSAGINKSVQVRVTDLAGNTTTSSSMTLTLDNIAPVPPTFDIDPHTSDNLMPITWSSPAGAVRYEYSESFSGPYTLTTGNTYSPGSPYSSASQAFYVRAGDNAGNWSSTATANFTVYDWEDSFVNGTVVGVDIGSMLLGGLSPNSVGAGQSGVSIGNLKTLETFGVFLDRGFGGQTAGLRLDIRDSSGVSQEFKVLNLPSDFNGGWVYWTDIGYTAHEDNHIVTVVVMSAAGKNLYSAMGAGTNAAATHGGAGLECTQTSDAAMLDWSNWIPHSGGWDFWYRAYGY